MCHIRARCVAVGLVFAHSKGGAGHGSDRIRDSALPLAGGVQVDKGGAGAAVAHPVHQFAEPGTRVGCKRGVDRC
jgi:hypothetical protein